MLARRPQSATCACVGLGPRVQNSCRGLREPPAVASVNFNEGRGHQALGGGPHLRPGSLGQSWHWKRPTGHVPCPKPFDEVKLLREVPKRYLLWAPSLFSPELKMSPSGLSCFLLVYSQVEAPSLPWGLPHALGLRAPLLGGGLSY